MDDIFAEMDNVHKKAPKKSKEEEDEEMDGDDLLDMMDNL